MLARTENENWFSGWRGVGLIAITYIYFLIFAQFGFLKRLADLGIAGDQLKIIMGAMAAGGILTSLLAPRFESHWQPVRRLQTGFLGCGVGAFFTLLPLDLQTGTFISFLIGSALGVLTVTLVTHLNLWIGTKQPLLKIGLGVGLAYFVCNDPKLFNSPPAAMALVSAMLCFVGIGLANRALVQVSAAIPPVARGTLPPYWLALGCFTALVWLDSAAFYIIQNTPDLKSGTWEGSRRLWQNGEIHFLAALGSSVLLLRRGLSTALSFAFVALACACSLLNKPGQPGLAAVFYPLGVSLYSVALVAYPAYLASTKSAFERSRIAGRLYAVAGWLGSGLGIGMAENLRHIPPAFVLCASLLFFAPWIWKLFCARSHEILTTGMLLIAALGVLKVLPAPASHTPPLHSDLLVNYGREVYIAEGCINCHSQYVRPDSSDEMMWGPTSDVDIRRAEQPPLIGNRRQGPDLTQVGDRRSALWLRAHFMNPAMLSHDTPMPNYAHLFIDDRGDALIAYMESLGGTNHFVHLAATQTMWQLSDQSITSAHQLDGTILLQKHCVTCHSLNGLTRQTWKNSFKRLPPDLATGPFIYVPLGLPPDFRLRRIAQIIKFGLSDTDMPGHEYLPDEEVAAMAGQIIKLSAQKGHENFDCQK